MKYTGPIGNVPVFICSTTINNAKTSNVKPKLINDETFFENRNIYFGTLTFENIPELDIKALMPPLVDSLKYANKRFPQNR